MTTPGLFLRRMGALVFLLAAVAGSFAADGAKKSYQVPAGDAAVSLKRFSEQSGEQIVYPLDAVGGVRTNAVSGEFTAREALDRLVAGTDLRVVQDAKTGALAVNRAGGTEASGGTGALEGRVFNLAGGNYVSNARVAIEALRLETFTDQYGQFRFPRVPAGDVTIKATYTGFPAEILAVKVTAGQSLTQDITLRSAKDTTNETVKLDAFTVASTRDMAASDVAVNEQRYSAAIKNVVSADSFGDIAEGNIGEFAKFLPGVTLNRSGSDGFSISVGGVPSGATPIMVDGNPLSSAASSGGSRTVELEQISITTSSRVDITRSQTPDSPANAIGGTVNLVSRNAFERARPLYTIRTYLSFKGGEFGFKKRAGEFNQDEYPFEPNGEFTAIVPVNKNFGFTVSALSTHAFNNGQGSLLTWAPTATGNYNLTAYRLQERPKLTVRDSIGVTADWRLSRADVINVGFQYAYFGAQFWVRQLNFATGTVASSGPDFTQGANGSGSVQQIYDAREKAGTTYVPTFRYKHTGPVWEWQINGAFSHSTNFYRNIDKGYFNANNAFLRNVTIGFSRLTFDHPQVLTVRNATNTADVDPYVLSNYNLESVAATHQDGYDTVRSVTTYAKRDFEFLTRITTKVGVDLKAQHRDLRSTPSSATYLGADGVAVSADNNAAQFLDPTYSNHSLLFGPKAQWMNLYAIGSEFKSAPSHFTEAAASVVSDYRSAVTGSDVIDETTVAPYLRLDTSFFRNRLQLTGGVRYERTTDDSHGPLVDVTKTYQRDAAGNIVRNAAGVPVVAVPLSTLAGTQLAYIDRGAHGHTSDGDFYPSLSATYLVLENLVARASYAASLSRPEFTSLFPSATLPDPATTSKTITLSNPNLKPWTANSWGLALEYYFNQPSSGVISARAYRRDIKDFWGTNLVPATPELLEPYGIDPTLYGAAQGYLVSTTSNVGSARVFGTEFDYRQNLTFLPRWARGFTVFGNLTMQHLEGAQGASFSGLFVAKTANFGISFSRERLTLRVAVNQKGTVRQGQITAANQGPGTYQYILPRNSADFSAEYRVTRNLSVFVGGRNVNEATDDTVIYGPTTPSDRILSGRADYRAYWNIGLKGTF